MLASSSRQKHLLACRTLAARQKAPGCSFVPSVRAPIRSEACCRGTLLCRAVEQVEGSQSKVGYCILSGTGGESVSGQIIFPAPAGRVASNSAI
jgi:hypothetical protein